MSSNAYYQREAARSRDRQATIVKRDQQQAANETASAKQYRLIEATVRAFAKEFPERAMQIVSEAAK